MTWKDGSAILWDAGYAEEFERRMRDLGVDPSRATRSSRSGRLFEGVFSALSDDELVALGRKYGLTYCLFDLNRKTRLPVVWQNDRHKIAELQ